MRAGLRVLPLLFLVPSLVGQSNSSTAIDKDGQQPTFTLKEEVRNVVVDVVVTNKHGEPVRGLGRSSFQVLENGVPQDVLFFEEHGTEERAKAAPQPALPPDTYTNVTEAPSGGPLLVLLLDAINTRPDQQSYVHAQVIEYLKGIPAGTRMAIFTLGDQLQMIQGFTSDPLILKDALSGRSYPQSSTLAPGNLLSTGNRVMSVRASLLRFGNGPSTLGDDLRVRYTIDALNAIAAYLADIAGRKSLIWFAGSVPWTINPDFSLVTDATGRVDYSEQLKQLADVMTLGRIAIYPIDAHGLSTPPMYGADGGQTPSAGMDPSSYGSGFHSSGSGNPQGGGGGFTNDNRVSSGSAFGAREMGSQMNIAGNHMSMSNLAAATGGRALYNTNGLAGAVAKVEAIGNDYYSIAYSPHDRRYDGGLRKIDVVVGQAGVRLEYRRGYYAGDPDKTAHRSQIAYSANPLHESMKRGAPDSTQIPFRVQVREAAAQPTEPADRVGRNAAALKGPVVRYDFHWDVDPGSIAFTTGEDGMRHAELGAALDAYDADGTILNDTFATLPLDLTEAQYEEVKKAGLHMKESLDVPAGLVYLRAGVVDPNSGHTGATEFPLSVSAR
jgi:VWFA-related protein